MKFGYQDGHDIDSGTSFYNHTRVNYRFNNGVPNRLTMHYGNWRNDQHTSTMASTRRIRGRWIV